MSRRIGKIIVVGGLTGVLVGPFLNPVPPLKGTLPHKDRADDDRIVPTAESNRLAGELPKASLWAIENCGYPPYEEQPEAFMGAACSFLETIPAS
jgi:hypothetical protein